MNPVCSSLARRVYWYSIGERFSRGDPTEIAGHQHLYLPKKNDCLPLGDCYGAVIPACAIEKHSMVMKRCRYVWKEVTSVDDEDVVRRDLQWWGPENTAKVR